MSQNCSIKVLRKRYEILTKNTYKNTVLKESHMAAMDEFVDNIKILINALGYKVLEPLVKKGEEGGADSRSQTEKHRHT